MAKQLKVVLTRSLAGTLPVQRRTVKALGLGKIGSWRVHEDNPVTRGMIRVVAHMVKVEEV